MDMSERFKQAVWRSVGFGKAHGSGGRSPVSVDVGRFP